jgi:hypothetical protein
MVLISSCGRVDFRLYTFQKPTKPNNCQFFFLSCRFSDHFLLILSPYVPNIYLYFFTFIIVSNIKRKIVGDFILTLTNPKWVYDGWKRHVKTARENVTFLTLTAPKLTIAGI